MARPDFNAAIIAELRERVIAHNRTPGVRPAKLGALKAAYAQGWDDPRRTPGPAGRNQAALAKVDAHLHTLAKAEDFSAAEHPRDGDGKFAAKGSGQKPAALAVRLPATQADHKQLMADNAGYAALQTAVIPETRYGMDGGMLRDFGSLATGIALSAGLARGKPNGLSAKAFGAVGSVTGRLAGSLTASLGSQVHKEIAGAVLRMRGKDTALKAVLRRAAAQKRIEAASKKGAAIGAKIGQGAFKTSSWPVRQIAEAAEASSQHPKAARGAAIAVMGLPAAYAVRSGIQSLPWLDPQAIGHSIDAYNYRTVQKMVMGDDIADAQALMLDVLNKGGDFGDLRKAMPRIPHLFSNPAIRPHAYGKPGKAILAGAAGLAGALSGGAVGAGAGHLTGRHGGNPNHDAKGRFASSSNAHVGWGATIGAALGGVAAAGGIYLALKSHNVKILKATALAQQARFDRLLQRVDAPKGAGAVRTKVAGRTAAIQEAVDKKLKVHPQIRAADAAHANFNASNPAPFKVKMEDAVNTHMAQAAMLQDAFRVKDTAGVWTSIGDIKAGGNVGTRVSRAEAKAREFIARATPAEFDQAIAGLRPEEQTTHLHWFSERPNLIAGVDAQLAAHHAKIEAAAAKVEAARATWTKADADALDAKALTDRGGSLEEVRDAGAAQTIAEQAATQAAKAHDTASKALDKLRASAPEVRLPPAIQGGAPIGTPTQLERRAAVDAVYDSVRQRLTAAAGRAYDKGVTASRDAQRRFLVERSNRNKAALALLGERIGVPRNARAATAAAATAHRAVDEIRTKLSAATEAHLTAPTPETAARLHQLNADLTTAVATQAAAGQALHAVLTTEPPASEFKFLPDHIMAGLKADLAHAKGSMSAAAQAVLDRPTMKSLANFATAQYGEAKTAATDSYNTLFRIRQPDGSYKLHWAKVATRGPLVATGAAGVATGAKEFLDYGRAKAFGTDAEKKNAKRPVSPFTMEHRVNALTGAHYAALTMAHPDDKNDRVVLYGERGDNLDVPGKQLIPGGRLSDVRGQFQNNRWNDNRQTDGGGQGGNAGAPHTGGLDNFNDQTAREKIKATLSKLFTAHKITRADIPGGNGAKISYREDGSDAEGADGVINAHMKSHFLGVGKSTTDKASYFGALKALFSNQAQVLTRAQAYRILTNRNEKGGNQKAGFDHGIFANSDGFNADGDKPEIARSLAAEIDFALRKLNPNRDEATNLHRAVDTVGAVKGLSAEMLAPIHAAIGKSYGNSQNQQQRQQNQGGAQNQQNQQQRQQTGQGGQGASAGGRPLVRTARSAGHDSPPEQPASWDKDQFDNLTHGAANQVRNAGGGPFAYSASTKTMAKAIEGLAVHAHALHDLTMHEAVAVAKAAILARMNATGARDMHDSINAGYEKDDNDLAAELDNQANRMKARRDVNKLDSLDEMLKAFGAFDSAKHPRDPAGQHGGGEFAAGSGGGAAAASAAVHAAGAEPRQSKEAGVSELHPSRAIPDIAMQAGQLAAWHAAGHYLPSGAKAGAAVGSKIAAAAPGLHANRAAKLFPGLVRQADALGQKAAAAAAKYPEGNAIRTATTAAAGAARQAAGDAGVHAAAKQAAAKLAGGAEKATFGAAASQAAFNIAERFLPPSAKAAVGALSLGAKFVASGAGALAASTAADAAVSGAYHLAGAKVPKAAEAPESTGRTVAGFAGNMTASVAGEIGGGIVGGAIGTAIGGPAGTAAGVLGGKFVGGVVGGWAGGIASGRAYDWFAGYPEAHKQKAMQRFMSPSKVAA